MVWEKNKKAFSQVSFIKSILKRIYLSYVYCKKLVHTAQGHQKFKFATSLGIL